MAFTLVRDQDKRIKIQANNMSAVGTVLLQSPGWNEGKARYETLGPHRQKQNELRRSGTNRASISVALRLCRPYGAQ